MMRILAFVLALAFTGGMAVSSVVVNHSHQQLDQADHRGGPPLDASGCHRGPSGYHCH